MTNEKSTFGRYKIIPIGFNLSYDLSYEFIILQLPFVLNTSFDKCVSIWNYGFGEKNLLNPVKNRERNCMCQLIKKPLKFNERLRKKIGDLIDKKLLNLMRK